MTPVPEEIYTSTFDRILEWFKQVHRVDCQYSVIDLENTHLKLIELVEATTKKAYFRVLLKATYDTVRYVKIYPRSYDEINWLTQTETDKILRQKYLTATQVCVVQLDGQNNPVDEVLYTYSSEDKFVKIDKSYPA